MIEDGHDKERIRNLSRMLLEMAGGNFSYRIERSDHNDELEALIVTANMTSEELGAFLRYRAYINYGESCKHLAGMTFVLDDHFRIRGFNPQTIDILLYGENEMQGKPLANFLMEESRPVWQDFQALISREKMFDKTLELTFKARQFFIVPATCLVSTFLNNHSEGSILVTTVETILQREEAENELRRKINHEKNVDAPTSDNTLSINLSDSYLEKIGKAPEYIASNLENTNFSIRKMALALGTNEFKLRYGFKQLYDTTVFRYLQDQRLQKAKLLIQHSRLPLQEIAMNIGFKSAAHFSRVFKEKYGLPPREFRKLFQEKKGK